MFVLNMWNVFQHVFTIFNSLYINCKSLFCSEYWYCLGSKTVPKSFFTDYLEWKTLIILICIGSKSFQNFVLSDGLQYKTQNLPNFVFIFVKSLKCKTNNLSKIPLFSDGLECSCTTDQCNNANMMTCTALNTCYVQVLYILPEPDGSSNSITGEYVKDMSKQVNINMQYLNKKI